MTGWGNDQAKDGPCESIKCQAGWMLFEVIVLVFFIENQYLIHYIFYTEVFFSQAIRYLDSRLIAIQRLFFFFHFFIFYFLSVWNFVGVCVSRFHFYRRLIDQYKIRLQARQGH